MCSICDVTFTFPNKRFGEVHGHNVHYSVRTLLILQHVTALITNYQCSKLGY